MAVPEGEYGMVRVVKGRDRGRIGYYDDDEGEEAVVYFDAPLQGPWALIPRSHLEPVRARSLALERWKRKHPAIAKQLGVV